MKLESIVLVAGILFLASLAHGAAPQCSGNGVVFDDTRVCECFACFSGSNCDVVADPCTVLDTGGNPLVYAEYWEHNDTFFESVIKTDFRSSYQFKQSTVLEDAIRDLHSLAGNAETEVYTIVFGSGGTQLIAAATWALASLSSYDRMSVFAKAPYYQGYKQWADMYPQATIFNTSLEQDPAQVIEFVTDPANPTGERRSAVFEGSNTVHDMVYLWPSLTSVTEKARHDIMLFSMSKMSGHAGSRFGWALVRNATVAAQMQAFVSASQIHISADVQFRVLNIIHRILAGKGGFFSAMAAKFAARWKQVQAVFARQSKFAARSVPGQFYAWVECMAPTASGCAKQFEEAGILGIEGEEFGAEPKRFVRLELVVRSATFPFFLRNLGRLLHPELAHADMLV